MGDLVSGFSNLIGNMASLNSAQQGAGALGAANQAAAGVNPYVQMPGQVNLDPQTLATQNAVLSNIMGQVRQGGLNAQTLAQLQDVNNRTNQMNQQGIQGGLQQARMQSGGSGMGQSGILAALMGGQQGANTANQQGLNIGSQALQNKQNLLAMGGNQAANLQGQQLGAGQFNTEMTQQQRQANEQNAAQRAGGITNAGAGVANALNRVGTNQATLGQVGGNVAGQATNYGAGVASGSPWQQYFGGSAPSEAGGQGAGNSGNYGVDPGAWG